MIQNWKLLFLIHLYGLLFNDILTIQIIYSYVDNIHFYKQLVLLIADNNSAMYV